MNCNFFRRVQFTTSSTQQRQESSELHLGVVNNFHYMVSYEFPKDSIASLCKDRPLKE